MIILIPAYEPDHKLIALLRSITEAQPSVEVVLVDDGSGPDHASLFLRASELGGLVLTHPVNRGKGAALRTGFAWIAGHRPGQVVVCADCDGQHTATDILKVGDATTASIAVGRPSIVLGARHFTGRVPFRSRFGNEVTRGFFALATGIRLRDTQTGLRGYPASMLDWLGTIEGDRFEYELNTLLQAKPGGHPIVEVPIATIYLDENASSHFRRFRTPHASTPRCSRSPRRRSWGSVSTSWPSWCSRRSSATCWSRWSVRDCSVLPPTSSSTAISCSIARDGVGGPRPPDAMPVWPC